jgi:hypothetical protein
MRSGLMASTLHDLQQRVGGDIADSAISSGARAESGAIPPGAPLAQSRRMSIDHLDDPRQPPKPAILPGVRNYCDAKEEEAREERRQKLRDSDPLSVGSREYAALTHQLLQSLQPIVEASGDEIVLAAVETIRRFDYTIAVKTWRAVGGTIDLDEDDGDDAREFSRLDGNGCAKLVRLLIRESRAAWDVLMNAGLGDGVPVKMVERLEQLDAGLADRFPRAMEFVRLGLDEELRD